MTVPRPSAFAALLALAAGSWWLAGNHGTAPAVDATASQNSPGYYLNDATLQQTDASGRTTFVAHAARALQQDTGGSVTLETPAVQYRTASGRAWRMTSGRGPMNLMPEVSHTWANAAFSLRKP